MASKAEKQNPLGNGPQQPLLDRIQKRLIRSRANVKGFLSHPEPMMPGSPARGRQLLSGNFRFGGHLVQCPKLPIWDAKSPSAGFTDDLHSFVWLTDLAATEDPIARQLAQNWVHMWMDRFNTTKGEGWSPDVAGRRLINWISYAPLIMSGQSAESNARFFRCLGKHTQYLARRWTIALAGQPRFEVLTALLYSGISLIGLEYLLAPAAEAIGESCKRGVSKDGGLRGRNPEELLKVYSLLAWAHSGLRNAGHQPPPALTTTLKNIEPTLLSLRHADGTMARFHGGDSGDPALINKVFSQISTSEIPAQQRRMGFARLQGGSTCVIADVAPPRLLKGSAQAHASTLAFEMSVGRHPVVVNCGTGQQFGKEWRRAARSTQSHSTVTVNDLPTSKIDRRAGADILVRAPSEVPLLQGPDGQGQNIVASHDGYVSRMGMTHVRKLQLSADGNTLNGTDTLAALNDNGSAMFDRFMERNAWKPAYIYARFHLHPHIGASLDMGGNAISLILPHGEIWVVQVKGNVKLALADSVYLEKARLKPRKTHQIVLTAEAKKNATQINWAFTKMQAAPTFQSYRGLSK